MGSGAAGGFDSGRWLTAGVVLVGAVAAPGRRRGVGQLVGIRFIPGAEAGLDLSLGFGFGLLNGNGDRLLLFGLVAAFGEEHIDGLEVELEQSQDGGQVGHGVVVDGFSPAGSGFRYLAYGGVAAVIECPSARNCQVGQQSQQQVGRLGGVGT